MAGKKQFYLKFNVKDFRTDEKVNKCNAESVGVYIYIMCLLFDSPEKGKFELTYPCFDQFADILPQQNVQQINQQTSQQIKTICCCIAEPLAKHLPVTSSEVERALYELLKNNVLYLEGAFLCQKRMLKDVSISNKRSNSGKKGAAESNKRRGKKSEGKDDLVENLPQQNSQQKEQQKSNYISNYNYNSNLVDSEGVSNNTRGGAGEENYGGEEGEEILPPKTDEPINFNLHTPPPDTEFTEKDLKINPGVSMPFPSQEFAATWVKWRLYLANQKGIFYKSFIIENQALEELTKTSNFNESEAIKIINTSISRDWSGFFKSKNDKNLSNGVSVLPTNSTMEQQNEKYQRRKRE